MKNALIPLTALALLAGCGGSTADPCSGQSGVCITARVQGTATGLQQLRITASDPTTKVVLSPGSPTPFNLPVKLALLFPASTTGSLAISIDGLNGSGVEVAHTTQTVALSGTHVSATFTLNANSTVNDMSVPPDLTMVPVSVRVEQAVPDGGVPTPVPVVTGYELDPITFNVVASDPLGKTGTITVSGLPPAALPAPPPGSFPGQTVTFKTDYTGSVGSPFAAKASAVTSDGRSASDSFSLDILNAADPIFPLSPNDSTATSSLFLGGNSIGDFDNDGFADVASCSVASSGALGTYTVNVLFGAATGLPTTQPPLTDGRVQTYTFQGANATTTIAAKRLPCKGGDFDNDGKSDILVFDPSSTGGAGKGAFYILFGQARSVVGPSVGTLLNPTAVPVNLASINQDASFAVGDFFGTNRTAIAFLAGAGGATINIYIVALNNVAFAHPTGTSPAALYSSNTVTETIPYTIGPCGNPPIIRGFHAMDGTGKLDLLLWDPNNSCTPGQKPGMFVAIAKASPSPIAIPAPAAQANTFGAELSDACDVDGDGTADLVIGDGSAGGAVDVWFGTRGSISYPLDVNGTLDAAKAQRIVIPSSAAYDFMTCPPHFWGPASRTLILGTTRGAAPHLDIYSSSRTPTFVRQVPNPGVVTFGSRGTLSGAQVIDNFGGTGDVNGDGQNDLVVGVGTNPGSGWIIYGR